jgi:hypothetical protein
MSNTVKHYENLSVRVSTNPGHPQRKNLYILGRTIYKAQGTVMGNLEGKSKATPLQAWTGPEGSRRLRLPDF